jgi:hypothetical protein
LTANTRERRRAGGGGDVESVTREVEEEQRKKAGSTLEAHLEKTKEKTSGAIMTEPRRRR